MVIAPDALVHGEVVRVKIGPEGNIARDELVNVVKGDSFEVADTYAAGPFDRSSNSGLPDCSPPKLEPLGGVLVLLFPPYVGLVSLYISVEPPRGRSYSQPPTATVRA